MEALRRRVPGARLPPGQPPLAALAGRRHERAAPAAAPLLPPLPRPPRNRCFPVGKRRPSEAAGGRLRALAAPGGRRGSPLARGAGAHRLRAAALLLPCGGGGGGGGGAAARGAAAAGGRDLRAGHPHQGAGAAGAARGRLRPAAVCVPRRAYGGCWRQDEGLGLWPRLPVPTLAQLRGLQEPRGWKKTSKQSWFIVRMSYFPQQQINRLFFSFVIPIPTSLTPVISNTCKKLVYRYLLTKKRYGKLLAYSTNYFLKVL